ncbi:hypothetical protein [Flavobacterium panacagri]|uniref:hypothetical protein n=1 Tax=Flavobacterium panacagri TaxID=3034146 RepID=UPI0025A608B4|nr:hypothetical protein [Flavobacterium panacagri]
MKKLLFLSTVLSLIITSCSSDDNSAKDSSVLPKTITYTYPPEDEKPIEIGLVRYDGNKINSIIGANKRTLFTYTDNLITKQEVYEKDRQGKEYKTKEAFYTYKNGKLDTKISNTSNILSPDYISTQKTVYTHSSNEQISYITYSVNNDTKVETKTIEGTLTYENGNLVKRAGNIWSYVYEYDNKNNPLKNIVGLDLLLDDIREIGKNNVVKITNKPSLTSNPAIFLRDYTYDDKNYPTKNRSYTNGGTVEFDIEYTY